MTIRELYNAYKDQALEVKRAITAGADEKAIQAECRKLRVLRNQYEEAGGKRWLEELPVRTMLYEGRTFRDGYVHFYYFDSPEAADAAMPRNYFGRWVTIRSDFPLQFEQGCTRSHLTCDFAIVAQG